MMNDSNFSRYLEMVLFGPIGAWALERPDGIETPKLQYIILV